MAASAIFHPDFTPTPYWWQAYRPAAEPLAEVPRRARVAIVGGGYAGLSAALTLAESGLDAVVLEARELGFGASTRNGGAVSGGADPRRRGRSLRAGRAADRRGTDRLLLGEARPLCRSLDARAFRGASAAGGPAERRRAVRGLYGAARTPARGDRQRLLFRRHGCRALGQTAPGALVQRAPRRLPAARRHAVRAGAGHAHQPRRQRLAARNRARPARRRRCRHRHQRLYRGADAGPAPPPRADREPYHRDRGTARRSGPHADPEGAHHFRYQA